MREQRPETISEWTSINAIPADGKSAVTTHGQTVTHGSRAERGGMRTKAWKGIFIWDSAKNGLARRFDPLRNVRHESERRLSEDSWCARVDPNEGEPGLPRVVRSQPQPFNERMRLHADNVPALSHDDDTRFF